ncbi:MAG: translation initiation factor [Bacteroidota bacterium]|nr:translation initiation factor [Bacteroidota bacterium]
MSIVYSTNPETQYSSTDKSYVHFLPTEAQNLTVCLDKKQRAGKQVTLVKGFVGKKVDFEMLTKAIKNKCGTGGSFKDGEIIIQGDNRQKISELLSQKGYKHKVIN